MITVATGKLKVTDTEPLKIVPPSHRNDELSALQQYLHRGRGSCVVRVLDNVVRASIIHLSP